MKTYGYLSAVLFATALCLGCGDEKTKTDKTKTTAAGTHEHVHWCNVCGYVEENGKCHCDDKTAKKCEKCGFQEGSPACCVKELVAPHHKDGHYVVCMKCGELELDGKCGCDDKDAKVCPKCGKHEGSLYCRQHCGTKKDKEQEKTAPPTEAPPPKGSAQE